MSAGYAFAWLYVALLGSGVWIAVAGLPRRADIAACLGYGVVLGLVACGLLVAGRAAPGAQLAAAAWPWFAATLAVVAVAAAWRVRRAPADGILAVPSERLPWWGWALLALLAWRFLLIVDEAWLRPVFAWDTWIAWAAKAKVWFESGQAAHYVAPPLWIDGADANARTSLAWHYPELLSRIDLWLASASGAWNEAAIGLAWPALWLAMLAGCYGQWRALGLARPQAVLAVYALGSLPLINVHAALAGYADLWIAAILVFAVLAWQRWLVRGERAQLVLCVALLATLPLIKFEGMVWAVALAALIAFGAVPPRWRLGGVAIALVLAAVAVLLSWWLKLAWLTTALGILGGGGGGRSATSLFGVLRAFASGLFAQYNWHLLWLVVPALVALRWRLLREDRALALLALFVAGAVVFVVGLFALTPAAKWAESNTAINRLVLQIVPVAVSLCALWLRDLSLSTDTDRATSTPPDPA
ncbi:hypothetical protein [Tahibacter soli]|uniref:Uncharacterized protein n=1 Tax=Tahibacter soli TaxID=2983605 RepID=A0A9X3YGG6_9GAMM|nr:hypothetical protein [Tahibacter soli]MDC8011751.1 hypothetical protein [Tahibacter soli]